MSSFIKALVVPWHQFVYTLFIQCGRLVIRPASFRSSSFVKRLAARSSFIFENRKKSDGLRSGLYGRCSKMCQCICAARFLSVGQYADVHCRATEQFHARACLFGKITKDLIGLHKTDDISLLTVGGILNQHSHGHSYLCTYHVTRSDVQLREATFQHHTEHQKPVIGCNKTGGRTVCANFLYFLDGPRRLFF